MNRRIVLATDLDGTMAHGTTEDRAALAAAVRAHPDSRLIYVTGRTPASAAALVRAERLPEPDVLIADVGTSVLHGIGPRHVEEIEAELAARWPGADEVHRRLAALPDVAPQDIDSPRRVGYWIEPVRARRAHAPDPFAARDPDDASLDEESHMIATRVAREAAAALDGLDVDVLVSANVFLDVLPHGVNKGSTLRRVLEWLDVDDDDCIVAGDSLNDLALFETGLRGIVVGNCEPALLKHTRSLDRIYHADRPGAAGVLEGLRHHFERNGDDHGK